MEEAEFEPIERFYKVSEVAAMLRVSKMSVYRLIETGELDAVKIGRQYRVTHQALDRCLSRASVTVYS